MNSRDLWFCFCVMLWALVVIACKHSKPSQARIQPTSFQATVGRLAPTQTEWGYRESDHWIWCGSVIKDDSGRYHMFASRWSKKYPMLTGYVFHSHIVHAVATQPQGPYVFSDTAIGTRAAHYWDAKMAHNPSVIRANGRYYLYYIGSTYSNTQPTDSNTLSQIKEVYKQPAYKNIRIGVAYATSLWGPWVRCDTPILKPTVGHWDSVIVTNPAPVVEEDGSISLIYRSVIRGKGLRLGLAHGRAPLGPFRKVGSGPIAAAEVEDPFIWKYNKRYFLLAKDMTGKATGEIHAGVFMYADTLSHLHVATEPKAYSRTVQWTHGPQQMGSLERPFVLFDDEGKPVCLFFAVADGSGGFANAQNTWNLAIPLQPPSK